MESFEFSKTLCALCETDQHDKVVYPANFSLDDISFKTFSARRMPDHCHYRIVQCQKCGLIRSNPVLDSKALAFLYAGSQFTYHKESVFAAQTYTRYAKKVLKTLRNKKPVILEIGCGNGSFLRKMKELGAYQVWGVEPSQEAALQAPDLKENIRVGMFEEGLCSADSFDFICAFQVFDHISDPNRFLSLCRQYLHPSGRVLLINHDAASWTARILKEKSPIFDIEHTFLYDKKTLRKILEKNQFEVLDVFDVANTYPLSYWFKLAPLGKLKNAGLAGLESSPLGKIPLKLKLGNIGIVARVHKS